MESDVGPNIFNNLSGSSAFEILCFLFLWKLQPITSTELSSTPSYIFNTLSIEYANC